MMMMMIIKMLMTMRMMMMIMVMIIVDILTAGKGCANHVGFEDDEYDDDY